MDLTLTQGPERYCPRIDICRLGVGKRCGYFYAEMSCAAAASTKCWRIRAAPRFMKITCDRRRATFARQAGERAHSAAQRAVLRLGRCTGPAGAHGARRADHQSRNGRDPQKRRRVQGHQLPHEPENVACLAAAKIDCCVLASHPLCIIAIKGYGYELKGGAHVCGDSGLHLRHRRPSCLAHSAGRDVKTTQRMPSRPHISSELGGVSNYKIIPAAPAVNSSINDNVTP